MFVVRFGSDFSGTSICRYVRVIPPHPWKGSLASEAAVIFTSPSVDTAIWRANTDLDKSIPAELKIRWKLNCISFLFYYLSFHFRCQTSYFFFYPYCLYLGILPVYFLFVKRTFSRLMKPLNHYSVIDFTKDFVRVRSWRSGTSE